MAGMNPGFAAFLAKKKAGKGAKTEVAAVAVKKKMPAKKGK